MSESIEEFDAEKSLFVAPVGKMINPSK